MLFLVSSFDLGVLVVGHFQRIDLALAILMCTRTGRSALPHLGEEVLKPGGFFRALAAGKGDGLVHPGPGFVLVSGEV
jgi:hypothetical protein